jgi:hypothetical protein
MNPTCRGRWRRANWPEKMDRVPAAVKKMPMTASTVAGYPGTRRWTSATARRHAFRPRTRTDRRRAGRRQFFPRTE